MIIIKEEFLTHEKLARAVDAAGYEALAVWIAIKSFCGTNLTDGFISFGDVAALKLPVALSKKKMKTSIDALISCGKTSRDGSRGPGLLVMVDGGYEMHDYGDHSNSREQVELQREKQRLKKAKQRENAKNELQLTREERMRLEGGQSPKTPGVPASVPQRVPMGTGNNVPMGQPQDRPPGTTPGTSRDHAGTHARPSVPTQPNPTHSTTTTTDQGRSRRRFSNLDDSLHVNIHERAEAILGDPLLASFTEPHKWPEVLDWARRFATAVGWRSPKFPRHDDSEAMHIVELFARHDAEAMELAITRAETGDYVRSRLRTFSQLTPKVMAHLIEGEGDRAATDGETTGIRKVSPEDVAAREARDEAHKAEARRKLGLA